MAHHRQRGLRHHGAKTTERKGGFVGQPLKEKNKTEEGGGRSCASRGHPSAFGQKSRSAALVCKSREGRFWKLVPSLFVYKDLL